MVGIQIIINCEKIIHASAGKSQAAGAGSCGLAHVKQTSLIMASNTSVVLSSSGGGGQE